MTTRFIFISGGVCSSLGKGIAAASLGALLQARGFSVKLRKLEQYLNIDSGTMNPIQHGEVYVTDDGLEADIDLGHYERFTGVTTKTSDYTTMGKIYSQVFKKERKGDYLGSTIQVIPHITDEIKNFIRHDTENVDFVLCEIGGTVGDIEGLAYIEAVRQLCNELGAGKSLNIHLTLIPFLGSSEELKTKPTQHSVQKLLSLGIHPSILLCRTHYPLSEEMIDKISLFCNVDKKHVIEAIDVNDVHEVPITFHEQGLDERVCEYFDLKSKVPDLTKWHKISRDFRPTSEVRIGLIGKYVKLKDSYKSIIESIKHAGYANSAKTNIICLDCEDIKNEDLDNLDAILIPGGFGHRGNEGKLKAITYARKNRIPFLGICLGMQLAVIEFARNVLGLKNASSTEFGPTSEGIVGLIEEWMSEEGLQKRDSTSNVGGTMRLGSYPCVLKNDSLIQKIYGRSSICERHRHRYEVNYENYKRCLEEKGFVFSGLSPDQRLAEIVEYTKHRWFIGVQFHPEFKSTPFKPHPLFSSFIKASIEHACDKSKFRIAL